jgi:hypothetical protein
MREGSVQEGIARQLVGRKHLTGEISSLEIANNRTTVTSTCASCGGVTRGISLNMAANATKYPSQQIITCAWGCKYVPPAEVKQTLADVLQIPESRRSSAQQRIVIEAEHTQRVAQRQAPIKAAQAQATRAVKGSLWDARERYLQTLAHAHGVQTIADPRVLNDPAYFTWDQWLNADSEQRDGVIALTNDYFQANGLR